MKTRIFYVINLDKSRITLIAATVLAALLGSYAFGYHSASQARDQIPKTNLAISGSHKAVEGDLKAENQSNNPEYGKSIYDQNNARQPGFNNLEPMQVYPDEQKEPNPQDIEQTQKVLKKKYTKKTNRRSRKKTQKTTSKNIKKSRIVKKKPNKKRIPGTRKTALLKQDSNGIKLANISSTKESESIHPQKKTEKIKKKPLYSLQTGSFHSKKAALRMAKGLKSQGFPSKIIRRNGKFNVRVGAENENSRLWKMESQLRRKKYSPIKVRSR